MAERHAVSPASARETAVAQTCSIDIARGIERRWQRRSNVAAPVLKSEGGVRVGRCLECNQPASIAPTSSEYRGKGIIHHHWLCRECGHDRITVVYMPT